MKKIKLAVNKRVFLVALGFVGLISVFLFGVFGFFVYYNGRYYPRTYVAGVSVGGMSLSEAQRKLESKEIADEISVVVQTTNEDLEFVLPFSELSLKYDYDEALTEAFAVGRAGRQGLVGDLASIYGLFVNGASFDPTALHDSEALQKQVEVMAAAVPNPPKYPLYVMSGDRVEIERGVSGEIIDPALLKQKIKHRLLRQDFSDLVLSTKVIDTSMSESEFEEALARGQSLSGKSMELVFEDSVFAYEKSSILSFLDPLGGINEKEIDRVSEEISLSVNREAQNPVFVQKGNRVEEFTPGVTGVEVRTAELENKMVSTINELMSGDTDTIFLDIPIESTEPSVTLSEVNDLGINELIGVGTSEFRGSSSDRIYNISVAANRFDGLLVPPGGVFSFNNIVGDISVETGFKQAYVIQDGATVLGDGGGVCQVSTTMFRAALNSGLPIVERNQHSYRVHYYEQDSRPGIDATIYHPTVDFKFRNDTPSHILIQTKLDIPNRKLALEFYGADDGRIVSITEPKVLAASAPPPDLYIDDPTLPAGEVKQIDWAAGGANVLFNYKVVKDGEVLQDRAFRSNYRPWQAKYLRGTGPAQ